MASPAFNRNNNDRSAMNKPQDTRKKYCLLKFVNEQGRVLPRRLTGTSLKFQRKVTQAIAKARHLALMPYVADALK
jgi:small subunit ribosomal protein S18